jgi:hypothetical protein
MARHVFVRQTDKQKTEDSRTRNDGIDPISRALQGSFFTAERPKACQGLWFWPRKQSRQLKFSLTGRQKDLKALLIAGGQSIRILAVIDQKKDKR